MKKKKPNHFNWRWIGCFLIAMLVYALIGETSPLFAKKRKHPRNDRPPRQVVETPPLPAQEASQESVNADIESTRRQAPVPPAPSVPSVQREPQGDDTGSKPLQTARQAAPGNAAVQPQRPDNQDKTSVAQPKTDSRKPAAEVTNGWTTKPPPDFVPKARWHRGNLERHWEKHQAEFPEFSNKMEYGDAALYFFEHPPVGTLTKTNAAGDRLFYHQPSNTFGVTTADGVPKTMFRPNAGINYWRRQ